MKKAGRREPSGLSVGGGESVYWTPSGALTERPILRLTISSLYEGKGLG
jgi:hypothetical protein